MQNQSQTIAIDDENEPVAVIARGRAAFIVDVRVSRTSEPEFTVQYDDESTAVVPCREVKAL